MGSSHAGRQMRSCMATPLYCDFGASGPDGAGAGVPCRWSDFFSESRIPPRSAARSASRRRGCDCEAGVPMIEVGARL